MRALVGQVDADPIVRKAIFKRLNHENKLVRQAAAAALSAELDTHPSGRRVLLERLDDEDPQVRQATLRAMAKETGDSAIKEAVLKKLDDDDLSVRCTAARALAVHIDEDSRIRSILFEKLNSGEEPIIMTLVTALSCWIDKDPDIKKLLFGKLNHEKSDMRAAVVRALADHIGDPAIRDAVIETMNDESQPVRAAAVAALASWVAADSSIRSALLEKLNDDRAGIREGIVRALASELEKDETICAAFLDRLKNDVSPVRLACAEAFTRLPHDRGPGRKIWPRVQLWLSMDRRQGWGWFSVQQKIAERIAARLPGEPEIRSWVIGQLNEIRWSARLGAMRTLLAWPGGPPAEILGKILTALDDRRGLESYPARLTAASFLINRNETSPEAVELCLGALEYGTQPWEDLPDSGRIRVQAALILGKLEPIEKTPHVYEKLVHVLRCDENALVRDAAYTVLLRLARMHD